jgi:hypothetical protein
MKYIRYTSVSLITLAAGLPASHASVDLNSAAGFAVLGGTTVTSTGNTVLNGNLGVYPGTSITGFAPGIVNGSTYEGGTVAQQAASDAAAAYTALGGETPGQNLSGQDLGGMTLTPGVYQFTSSAQLTGQLIFNAQGNPNAQFVIQITSTLTTADMASVLLENDAEAGNVFWQVGSSATIGDGSSMDGSILADQNITMDSGANLDGNAIALNGAVTLDDNDITVGVIPEANSLRTIALCAGMIALGTWFSRRRRNSEATTKRDDQFIVPI